MKVDHTKVLKLGLISLLVKNKTGLAWNLTVTLQMLLVEKSHKPVIIKKWPTAITVIVEGITAKGAPVVIKA